MEFKDPAFNYDKHGHDYSVQRQTDPRIAEYVMQALGSAKTVLNVGAGAGSYEPADRYVVAIEPSAVMRAQRQINNKVPAINAKAGNLPFDDKSFDASMAIITIHHWPDIARGLQELRRVTKGPVIIMTFDPDALNGFWQTDYFSELIEVDKKRDPSIESIIQSLGGTCEVIPIPVPFDCTDGFREAYYGRPEAFLKKEVRQSQSAWGFLPGGLEDVLVKRLEDALRSGEWDKKYGHYRTAPTYTGALRLVISNP